MGKSMQVYIKFFILNKGQRRLMENTQNSSCSTNDAVIAFGV